MQATHTANPVSVNATRILEVTDITNREPGFDQSSPTLMLRLEDGRNFEASQSMTARHVPVPGDYVVTQEDGYVYLNPKDVFERKYSPATTDDAIEAQIQAVGANKAPRITPDDIKANIVSEHYFTAADGQIGAYQAGSDVPAWNEALKLLTFCVLVLRNGFTVTGKSACASPENFNADIGRKVAREDAVNQVWPLMGYALKEKMAFGGIDGRPTIIYEQLPTDFERLLDLRPDAVLIKRTPSVDIDAAVTRFLGWRLPDDFSPDNGIAFQPIGEPNNGAPIGTNLFTAVQARAMLEHCLGITGSTDFPLGKACDLSSETACEACQ